MKRLSEELKEDTFTLVRAIGVLIKWFLGIGSIIGIIIILSTSALTVVLIIYLIFLGIKALVA